MGKKKHKKKQKKAAQDEPAASSGSSSLHRIGQALLDQARSPAGRQLLATGLIVAASAIARETGRRTTDEPATAPTHDPQKDESAAGPQPGEAAQGPQSGGTTRSGMPEIAAFAGMALSALDQFLHRPSSGIKG